MFAPYFPKNRNLFAFVIRIFLVLALIFGSFVVQPATSAQAAGLKAGVPAAFTYCVRPGGTSRPVTYGLDTGATSTPTQIYDIEFHNVPAFGWILDRGYFEYSTN